MNPENRQEKSPFMASLLAEDPSVFDRPIEEICRDRPLEALLEDCDQLEAFWKSTKNLYLRVRALVFLYYLHRFVIWSKVEGQKSRVGNFGQGQEEDLPEKDASPPSTSDLGPSTLDPVPIPLEAHRAIQSRNFSEAIDLLLEEGTRARLNWTLSSGLAIAYHELALQNLADQVRRSVRQEVGNQWMFRIGHPDDFPLKIRKELKSAAPDCPWLVEQTPVRMDISHSSWSDIFFLGMDRPEFAKVINASIDLAVNRESGGAPVPPCLSAFRIIDRPVIRLVSLDLESVAEVADLGALFDFGRDYLGLLKAALIASGIIPPGMEGARSSLDSLLKRLIGPGKGIELVSWVRDIPKGSRLAVSTNLLGSLVTVCMRATSQIGRMTGTLTEDERRIVASRAILGEWLGGSGGGWQDSGGIWPGLKLIEGCFADGSRADPMVADEGQTTKVESRGQPEISQDKDTETHSSYDQRPLSVDDRPSIESRGALLPRHSRLDGNYIPEASVRALEDSLILFHGGMAANVGPILEMVTERYLLRSISEWKGRAASLQCTTDMLEALREGDIKSLGRLTTEHFFGPLKTVIPWASNAFTERFITEVSGAIEGKYGTADSPGERCGSAFWGFWMLGGMSGGGMGLIVRPDIRDLVKPLVRETLQRLKDEYQHALPFAMDPVIYNFKINRDGSRGSVATGTETGDQEERTFLKEYYRFQLPALLQKRPGERTAMEHLDLTRVRGLSRNYAADFIHGLLPEAEAGDDRDNSPGDELDQLLEEYGFDRKQHEQIREELKTGRVGLSQNRLHPKTRIENVDSVELGLKVDEESCRKAGLDAIREGRCMVLTLAAGAGSRWTQGAGVVKALHPFAPINGTFRNFLEFHLAKSSLSAELGKSRIPHVITTSYLTDDPIRKWAASCMEKRSAIADRIDLKLSTGRSVGLRMVPTERDLRYAWYELPQERLDEQAEKMRDSVRQALIRWACDCGEGSDYRDNLPLQCLHPVGHWYEVPNMFLNGTLHDVLQTHPDLKVILLHNIDTLGASLDPVLLGHHLLTKAPLSYEMIQRSFDDVGGGLARVDGILRLVEGFALPREEDEFKLSWYNSLNCWIDLDQMLAAFGLRREDFMVSETRPGGPDFSRIQAAVRKLAASMPTYITLKETKKRWGRGQEDIFPVLQFERLWGDMSALFGLRGGNPVQFVRVSRERGQQLKDPAQLDAWCREGSLQKYQEWLGRVL